MNSRPQLFGMLAGLFLAAGLVLSAMLATTTWLKVKNSQFITVKGSARKNVRSDLVIWRGSFGVEADTLLAAQKNLRADRDRVESFLCAKSFTNAVFTPIGIEELKATQKTADGLTQARIVGYRLAQTVRVESGDVDRVAQLDTDSTALVEQGVVFATQPPEFIYTKAGEAKIEMLAEATKDARARAEQIAAQGDRVIARLHNADMGVIQIAPMHSVATSWEGMNDTTSLDKTITAVVTGTFALK
ncbi:MAG: SIMPL domain-containing protein [Verrucomicrobia bacterium]|nr:SIMPL domain-containing protein [Verrucomicrobiota bacterium]